MLTLAVLQNMWGPERRAPLAFRINPRNHSGRRLYRLTEGHNLWVTNSSSVCAPAAHIKCAPDDRFLLKALARRKWEVVLVCGKQAQEAFKRVINMDFLDVDTNEDLSKIIYDYKPFIVFMPHPAARSLTNKLMDRIKRHINNPDREVFTEFKL